MGHLSGIGSAVALAWVPVRNNARALGMALAHQGHGHGNDTGRAGF